MFLICDDLNDFVEGMGGHPQAYTPNISRLARMGVLFTNAHSNAPMCAPSRPSFLSGLYPSTTGIYDGKRPFRESPQLKDAVLFPAHFKANGYRAYSAGKLFHDPDFTVFGASEAGSYDGGFLGPRSNYGPYPWDGKLMRYGERPSRDCPDPFLPQTKLEYEKLGKPWTLGHGRLSRLKEGWSWVYSDHGFLGADGKDGGLFSYEESGARSLLPDELVADWGVQLLEGEALRDETGGEIVPINDAPFFLSLGFVKTHLALYSPDEFYDEVLKANGITEKEVVLPWAQDGKIRFGDWSDIPKHQDSGSARRRYKGLERAEKEYEGGLEQMLRDYTLSYLAAVYVIDVQVGKVLDALEKTGRLEETILVFTSDHGYHHGDKESFFKYTLWEKSTRVPLIICDPSEEFKGTRGKTCDVPVSLIDLYPTFVDLCDLPRRAVLEGVSLKPLLANVSLPVGEERVALSAVSRGKGKFDEPDAHAFSVRSKSWRYILGPNGEEELYDHRVDPYELTNLAERPEFHEVKVLLHTELCRLSGRTRLYR
ncbi:MAG: sulfatase [Verrucomicrobiota bacterium]